MEITKPKRRRFNQSTIFEYFKAVCEECKKEGKTTVKDLTAHHRNGNPADVSVENLAVLCVYHHRKLEGILSKKRDLR